MLLFSGEKKICQKTSIQDLNIHSGYLLANLTKLVKLIMFKIDLTSFVSWVNDNFNMVLVNINKKLKEKAHVY